ncbi:RDD family protein [Streptomyces uncialis]|uniref:RDD family protein n=1 Tax=Streptomyces uncialis TaxID=1048205 RepID=UPI003866EBA0|nr:RDD family protein [Streptomyces uncialis]
MSDLVTGEAVALELRPAKLPSRALAVVIDLAAAFAVYFLVMTGLIAATASLDEAALAAITVATFLLVLVGIPIAVETLTHGRSLGKLACGLRVLRDDGGPIRFRHALVRGGMGMIEILLTFGTVASIASLVSERGRRLGDVFGGTLVVRERVPGGRGGFVPAPPPWLAGRFSGLDLSGVPDELWLAVRQYLTRMSQLDPQVGAAMARRLAGELAGRTGADVPPGVPPAAFLAAVVHERQTRDARRAFAGDGGAAGWGAAAVAGYPGAGYAGSGYPGGPAYPGGPGRPGGAGYPGGGEPSVGGAGGAGAFVAPGGFVPPGAPGPASGVPGGPGGPGAGAAAAPGGSAGSGSGAVREPGGEGRRATGFAPPS